MLNTNNDRQLTWEEFYSFDIDEAVQKVPQCFNVEIESEEAEENQNEDYEADIQKGDIIDEEGTVENLNEEGKVENQDKTAGRDNIDGEGTVENQDKAGKGDNIDENGSKSRINNVDIKDTPFETNGILDTENVGDNVNKVTDNREINVDIISNGIFADDGIETEVLISEKSEETLLTTVNEDLNTDKNMDTDREDSTHDKRKLEHDEF
jgi:hypothetical protein